MASDDGAASEPDEQLPTSRDSGDRTAQARADSLRLLFRGAAGRGTPVGAGPHASPPTPSLGTPEARMESRIEAPEPSAEPGPRRAAWVRRPAVLSVAVAGVLLLLAATGGYLLGAGRGVAGTAPPEAPAGDQPRVPARPPAPVTTGPTATTPPTVSPTAPPEPTDPGTSAPSTAPAATETGPEPTATPSAAGESPTGRPNPRGVNLARGRPVVASGSEGDHFGPRFAVDGDRGTRWSSEFHDPQWITVDLGELWEVTRVVLFWERAYGTHYRVEVSADGRSWTTIFSTTQGQGGTVRIDAGATSARYVRMYGTRRVGEYGFSLEEFEVR